MHRMPPSSLESVTGRIFSLVGGLFSQIKFRLDGSDCASAPACNLTLVYHGLHCSLGLTTPPGPRKSVHANFSGSPAPILPQKPVSGIEDHRANRNLLEAVSTCWAGRPNDRGRSQFLLTNPPDQPELLRALRAGCDAEGHADDVISDSVELPIAQAVGTKRE
jgi:hypothetical protein